MSPQHERSMRIFVVNCVVEGHIPRKFGSVVMSNGAAAVEPELSEPSSADDSAEETVWDQGTDDSGEGASDTEESEAGSPEPEQRSSKSEVSSAEESENPGPALAHKRTPKAHRGDQTATTARREVISGQSSGQDSDTDASSCEDTSDEETSNTIRELTQVLEDAANQGENEAPAARQRAHQERAPAAGAGAARTIEHMAPVARKCARKEREAAGAREQTKQK